MQGRQQNFRGFSLYELMIAVLVLSILITLAVPPMGDFVASQRSQEITQMVASQMRAARELAVTTSKWVIVCGSQDGISCVKKDFNQLMVFADDNRNHRKDADELQLVVREFNTQAGNLSLTVGLNFSYLQFSPEGYGEISGSFIYCPRDPRHRRYIQRITTQRSGRVYIAQIVKDYGEVRADEKTKAEIKCP